MANINVHFLILCYPQVDLCNEVHGPHAVIFLEDYVVCAAPAATAVPPFAINFPKWLPRTLRATFQTAEAPYSPFCTGVRLFETCCPFCTGVRLFEQLELTCQLQS